MFNLASQEAHPAALETLILYMPLSADLTLLTVSVWKPSESDFMSYRNDGSTGTSLWNLEKNHRYFISSLTNTCILRGTRNLSFVLRRSLLRIFKTT